MGGVGVKSLDLAVVATNINFLFPPFCASVFRSVRRRLFLCQFCCLFVCLLLLTLSVSFSCFPIYFLGFPTYLKKAGLHDVIGSSTLSLS